MGFAPWPSVVLAIVIAGRALAAQSSEVAGQPAAADRECGLLRDDEEPGSRLICAGGEVRQQYERFVNDEWGAEPRDGSGYLLQRYMAHAEVHLGKRVRLFAQVKSGIEIGRRGGPRPTDEDRLDLHQSYVQLRLRAQQSSQLSVRIGRQEFQFGSSRLVSVRERPNVRQSFDAVRASLTTADWRVDGFVSRPVLTSVGVFDDHRDASRALWGAYATRTRAARGIDAYYFGYQRDQARYDAGTAGERRHSVGTRWWGRSGSFDYDTEVVAQWGTFGASRIRAWTVASDTGRRLRVRGRPRVGIRADITSGDGDRADQTLSTFHPLFPKGAYFGLIAPVGALNHVDLHPSAAFVLPHGWSATASWLFFWRTRRADGLYSVPGTLLRSGAGTHAHFVGHSPELELTWRRSTHVSATINLARFSAGAFLKETPPARAISYVSLWTTYRF